MSGRHAAPSSLFGRIRASSPATACVAVISLLIATAGVDPAGAAPIVSQGTGQYLGGSVLGTDLATVVALAPASAQNPGTPPTVTDVHPLDVTALSTINLNLGGGVQLPLSNVLTLGAVNQVAQANNDGSSFGASGTVTNAGAIGVGQAGVPQSTAQVSLTPLLPASVTSTIGNLSLSTGALAATANQAAPGTSPAPTGNYVITSLNASLTSPLLANTFTTLNSTLAGLQSTVDALQNTIATLLSPLNPGLVAVTGLPNLTNALQAINPVSVAGGAITVNPFSGAVSIDVAHVLADAGLNIDTLPPNTDLLPFITAALTNPTTGLLTSLTNALVGVRNTITTALNGIQITVGGVSTPISGPVQTAINTVTGQVIAPINTTIGNLGTNVVTPLVSSLSGVLDLVANSQTPTPPATGSTFTETALQVKVLGAAAPIQLNLASASVGPNAGPAAPTAAALTPPQGPDAGGTTVTITGTNLIPGATSVTIGGITVPASAVTVDATGTSLTFSTPAHPAGPVAVTVTTPGGTSAPLSYTYLPAAPVITSPASGSSTMNPAPPITGTGEAGDTVTVTEGGTTICTAVVDGTGHWSCTPTAPLAVGSHTITATDMTPGGQTSPPSSPVTFTILTPVQPTATFMTPTQGPETGGTTATITGTDFVPGATAVSIGGTTIPASAVTVNTAGTSLTFTTPAHAPGPVPVTVTTPGGTTTPALTYTYLPVAPAITGPADGSSVTTPSPTISGTGDAGDTVTVSEGGTTVCAALVDGTGHWSCTPTTPLPVGPHTVTATETTPGGQTSAPSSPVTFNVAAPVAATIAPNNGTVSGGTTVTITGTNFAPGATSVTIGGTTIPASAVTVNPGGTSLTFTTPAHAPGPVAVTATTPVGTSGLLTYTYTPPPAPVITGPANGSTLTTLTPTMAGTGEPGDTVTVTEGGTTICTATVDTTGQWSCTPTTPLTPGPHTITATETGPAGGTSLPSTPVAFVVAPPIAATISPGNGPSIGGTTVTITGTDFVPGQTTVTIGGTTIPASAVTVNPAGTSLTFSTPAHAPGPVPVTVTTPVGPSAPLTYTYNPPAPPTITSPANGGTVGTTTPAITGTGQPGDTVTVSEGGTVLCTATVDGAGNWSCTPTAPLGPGAHTITATDTAPNGGGTSAPSAAVTFTVAAPTAVGLTPNHGPSIGGTTVTVTGAGFVAGQTTVTIGGTTVPATAVTVDSTGTALTVTTPAHAPGPVDVTVTTPNGTTAPLTYIYDVPPAPVITSPANGSVLTTPIPAIGGTGQVGDAVTVTEGGVTICTATVDSTGNWSCTPTTPLGPGAHTITATETAPNGGGTSAPSTSVGFAVAAPTASGLSPSSGPAAGGTTVTITGSGFVPGATTVTIGGVTVPASAVTVNSTGTSLTFSAPAHAPGAVGVTVTAPVGTTAALTFTYLPPVAPVITTPAPGSTVTVATPPISGTGTPGDTVTVTEGGTVVCTAQVTSSGIWNCTPASPLANGAHTFTATQTDTAGNVSPASAPITITVAVPAAPASGTGVPITGETSGSGGSSGTGGSLASTGENVLAPLAIAVLLAALGAFGVIAARRREP